MRTADLRAALSAVPFRPFALVLRDGESPIRVEDPAQIVVGPCQIVIRREGRHRTILGLYRILGIRFDRATEPAPDGQGGET